MAGRAAAEVALAMPEIRCRGTRGEEALAWLTRYADAGSVRAIREGAWLLWRAGRVEETIAWIEARSADVDAYALWEMAEMLGEAEHIDRALEYCKRAGNRGDGGGFFFNTSVKLLAAAGRTAEARRVHRFGRDGRTDLRSLDVSWHTV